MRVNKARRRLMKWRRYIYNTGSAPSNLRSGGFHDGYAKAYSDVTYAHRWAPKGIRYPYFPKWSVV